MYDVGDGGNKRRALCVFPRYTFSVRDVRACLSADRWRARPDAAARYAGHHGRAAILVGRAVRRREHRSRDTSGHAAWADAVFVSGMHRPARRQIPRDRAARSSVAGKVAVLGGPSVSACPEYYPEFDYLHVGEMGDATDELIRRLTRDPSRPARSGRADDARAARTRRLPDSGLRAGAAQPLSDRQHPVFERLSLSMRVLRHPHTLWPRPAPQERGAGDGRARQDGRVRTVGRGLFRRRQFHRAPARGQRALAAPHRLAEAQRLYLCLRVRGDAQHRQAAGDIGADARGFLRDRVLRDRDAGARGAEGDVKRAQHDGCRSSRRSGRSTGTASRSRRASSSASTPTRRRRAGASSTSSPSNPTSPS